jgi:hydrogenase expression/formation protein HypC
MCLAIPAKVVEISKGKAKVDFGGVSREIDISLVDTKIGDYVLVHAGFAIEIMDEQEAKETWKLWEEMLEKCSDTETRI